MAFTRPANNKQLTFNEVALKTKLPENEVELLVMRALSLGLVKGSIDQIDKSIFIGWVQPRVLDISQVFICLNLFSAVFLFSKFFFNLKIKMMRARLDTWALDVNKMICQVQTHSHEILT